MTTFCLLINITHTFVAHSVSTGTPALNVEFFIQHMACNKCKLKCGKVMTNRSQLT